MADSPPLPTKVCVLGEYATREWVRFVARLNSDEGEVQYYPQRDFPWTDPQAKLLEVSHLATMLEEFHAMSMDGVVRALWGSIEPNALSKIVILDDSFLARTSLTVAHDLRRSKKNWLFNTSWHFIPAFLELVPTTFVALTTNEDLVYHAQLRSGGFDLVFNPLTEPASMLKERLLIRRDAIQSETDFSVTRNQRYFVWAIVASLVAAPLLVELIKTFSGETTKFLIDMAGMSDYSSPILVAISAAILIVISVLVIKPALITARLALIPRWREPIQGQTHHPTTLFRA
ncbi:MAG: hypothetical protein JWN70_5976 [Planctomycetaceae bacterium]|nr:hypothetical protein [Planctomycetaceae bacterium]